MEKKDSAKRLLAYSTAAGLGAFAFGSGALASVVYVDIPDQSLLYPSNPDDGGQEIALDIDGDTDIDFRIQFVNFGNPYAAIRGRSIDYNLSLTNAAVGNIYYVRAFDQNAVIGFSNPSMGICNGPGEILKPLDSNNGGFGRSVMSFMGIALHEDGSPNYNFGWIRIQTTFAAGLPTSVTVYDFAYETQANTDIVCVPEPGCLSLLAAGLGGLALRRRTA